MRLGFVVLPVVAALWCVGLAAAQAAGAPVLTSPADGQVLQGQVAITGTTDLPNFASAELAFAYASDPTHTWFTVQTMSQPALNGVLAAWDTTSITDGDYTLRLRVILVDGTIQDATVMVEVRNYTALPVPSPTVIPTDQPVVQIPTPMLIPASETPTLLPPPTPTAVPPNSAAMTANEIYAGFWRGALVIAGLFLLVGVWLRLRRP